MTLATSSATKTLPSFLNLKTSFVSLTVLWLAYLHWLLLHHSFYYYYWHDFACYARPLHANAHWHAVSKRGFSYVSTKFLLQQDGIQFNSSFSLLRVLKVTIYGGRWRRFTLWTKQYCSQTCSFWFFINGVTQVLYQAGSNDGVFLFFFQETCFLWICTAR